MIAPGHRHGVVALALLAALTARAEGQAAEPPAAAPVAETPAEPGLFERLGARLSPFLPWRLAAHSKPFDDKAAPAAAAEAAKPVEPAQKPSEDAPAQNAEPGFFGRMTARLTSLLPGAKPEASAADAGPTVQKPATESAAAPPQKPEAAKPEAASVAASTSPAAPSDGPEPALAIRKLQDVQERVAGGDRAAFAEQPRLMKALTQNFAAAPPKIWGKVENARALVLYLLSGGSPTLGRKILATQLIAPSEEPLAKGALAYLEDRPGADQDYLLSLDPRALDLNLGGQVAFIQSILLTSLDRGAAIERLDVARLLMPGSLVEEAALRREVALLAETENFDKFAALARQYWTRFRASPYADNFLRQFTLASARVSLSIKTDQWARLDELLANLPPEARRAIYLNMAHAALVNGNVALAAAAAQRGLPLFAEGSLEQQRALLYLAAAEVATPAFSRAEAVFAKIDRARLTAGDALLAQATSTIAAQMRRPPQQGFAAEPPGEKSGVDAAMARAQAGLKAADDAMASVRQTMQRKTP